jgi:hypothetical protein
MDIFKVVILVLLICFSSVGISSEESLDTRPIMEYQSPTEVMVFTTTPEQCRDDLERVFSNAEVLFEESSYVLLDMTWFVQDFIPYFGDNVLPNYEYSPRFDCDDFRDLALLELQLCHLNSDNLSEGVFVAEVHYIVEEDGTRHVSLALFGIDVSTMNMFVVFYNPESNSLYMLSESEMESIYRIVF